MKSIVQNFYRKCCSVTRWTFRKVVTLGIRNEILASAGVNERLSTSE